MLNIMQAAIPRSEWRQSARLVIVVIQRNGCGLSFYGQLGESEMNMLRSPGIVLIPWHVAACFHL